MGYPFPDVEVEIHDPESGAALPDGEAGEIWVAGENVSPGYVRANESGLRRKGRWLRTGDLACGIPTASFRSRE